MATGAISARTTPAWYRRLPPALRRVAAESDRIPTLPLRAGPALQQMVAELPTVLAAGRCATVESTTQRIADGVCRALAASLVDVKVRARRPHDLGGELHGLYVPRPFPVRPEITVWMLTAKRGDVVKPRTFLRTLLHELCHHFDYTCLRLRESLHTQGFYQRESSLLAALEARDVAAGR
jgi:hypothetical protein